MSATLASIDAKLVIAAPYLHDGCRRDEAEYVINILLDARLELMPLIPVPCPSPS